MAVYATQQGIDPVGACVGIKGVRIQAIVRELHEEKIDVIEWNPDTAVYIAKAISPARVSGVYLNDSLSGNKTATVVVPEDQLSLAIGRDGQNARLAAKLTGWRIDIKSLPEATSDALAKLRQDASLAAVADSESNLIQEIEASLQKKAEGRPLSPEEYSMLTQFVDRVERRSATRRQADKAAEEAKRREALAGIPETVFNQPIIDSILPEHVAFILQEADYDKVGEVVLQMRQNPDAILALQGIGPKAMQEIQKLVASVEELVNPKAAAEAGKVEEVQPEPTPVDLVTVEIEPQKVEAAASEIQPVEITAPAEVAGPVEAHPGELEPVATELALAVAGETEETMATLDQFFIKPEELATAELEEEEGDSKKGKKKKKSRQVEIVYDPDHDTTIVHKKHKRGDDLFGWEE